MLPYFNPQAVENNKLYFFLHSLMVFYEQTLWTIFWLAKTSNKPITDWLAGSLTTCLAGG